MLANRSQASYASGFALKQQAGAGSGRGSPGPGSPARLPPPLAPAPAATPDRLLTGRSSYISYLEAQLERVSAACLTVASYDERLEQVRDAGFPSARRGLLARGRLHRVVSSLKVLLPEPSCLSALRMRWVSTKRQTRPPVLLRRWPRLCGCWRSGSSTWHA